ncbi:uncharacterized protein [Nicotiana tomentosiformis]|uniref:uncharacterized protein n=1 Tax=Nicotiana tomentosiformis TaxID=4098 RepID=UPI00388CD488
MKQVLSLEYLKCGNVSFRNGKKGEIIGVEKVAKTDSHSIENVYLIDGLKYSLISVSQLCDRENELTCLSVLDNDPLLWHRRLGHASLSQVNKLVSKDLVIRLPNIKFKKDKVCEACARGKFTCTLVITSKDKAIDMFTSIVRKTQKQLEESVHMVFDEANILFKRQEQDDEATRLVRNSNETTTQTEAALEEGTGDGTADGTQEKGKDLLVVQIYVDDIIFGATADKLSTEFDKLMGSEFEMSMMVTKLDIDEPGSYVDQKLYRGMIGSLLYLITSRPDIVFSVGLCVRFQVGYVDTDYAGFLVDRKRTSSMAHFLGSYLVSWATKKQNSVALSTAEAEYVVATSCCAQLLWIKQ